MYDKNDDVDRHHDGFVGAERENASRLPNSFFLLNRNSDLFFKHEIYELITTIIIFKAEKVFVKFSAQNELKLQSGPVLKQSSNKFV